MQSRVARAGWGAFAGVSSLALLMSGAALAASKENQASAAALLAMRHADEAVQAMRGNLNATLGAGGNGEASARALDAAIRSQIEIAKLLDSHISKTPLTPGRRGGGGGGGSGGGAGGIDLNGFMAGYIAALIDFEAGVNQAIDTGDYVVIMEEFSSFESYYEEYESWYEEITTTEEFSSETIEQWQEEIDTGSDMAVLADDGSADEPEALGAAAPEDEAAADDVATHEPMADAAEESPDGTDEAVAADEGGEEPAAAEDDGGEEQAVDDDAGDAGMEEPADEGDTDVVVEEGGSEDAGGDVVVEDSAE